MLESEVLKSIGKRLALWHLTSECVWYTRLNSGHVKTNYGSYIKLCDSGTPDFVAIIRNQKLGLDLLFIEIKRPGIKLKFSPDQVKFKNKYKNVENVHHLTVDHPDYVDIYIDSICIDRLKDIK